ncbi:MAG: diguanylate cyclase [Phycisphaeraceae bacterium]|nr:diguanylate cyclase [Phycisphaeraceae bacterium]
MEATGTRVILVGRTGLDAALRLDERIELVRVRHALEAIGEAAQSVSEISSPPVVVVAADVRHSLESQRAAESAGSLARFISGLRTAAPGVRILTLGNGSAGPTPHEPSPFDAVIPRGIDASGLVRLIQEGEPGASPGAPVSPIATATPPTATPPTATSPTATSPGLTPLSAAPIPEAVPSPGVASPKAVAPIPAQAPRAPVTAAVGAPNLSIEKSEGDVVLAAALLRGSDLLEHAVSLIRERTGDPRVRFVPLTEAAPENACAVSRDGVPMGALVGGPQTPASRLTTHAAWLATWLKLRDQQVQLRTAALTDPLTGAWNRRYFDRFLATALEQARQRRHHVTLLVLDIDDFKMFNDRYGHAAGDDILVETVRLMRSVIRPSDRVCRIGGDEFAVIFHDPEGPRRAGSSAPVSVMEVARRFQAQIANCRFPKLGDGAPGTLAVSGGMATYPWDGVTPAELLAQADALALDAKKRGKNAITYGPGAQRACGEEA